MRSTRLRHRLILSTALHGGLLLAAAPAWAQTSQPALQLPGPGDVVSSTGINTPVSSVGDTRLDVGVTANGATIDWKQFDIPTGNSINFNDETGGGGTPVAVLNRVVGDGGTITRSTIDGLLRSPTNMSVFLINSSGITFGPSGVVNVGSLIASTLDLSPADFAADASAGRYAFAGSGSGDIKVADGARLFATGSAAAGLGNLVLLGAKVAVGRDSGGTAATLLARNGVDPDAATIAAPTGDDGDVALIAADDVTVQMGTGSPLSIAIAKGTAVEGAFKVDGSIAGRNVTLALATRGGVTDTLLSVAGMTTANGAASTDRGVVLTAGRDMTGIGASGVTLAPNAPADIDPAGAIRTAAAISSGRGLAIAAAGSVTVAAATVIPAVTRTIDVAGDYAVTGSAVTLGTVGTPTEQAAGGRVTIGATGGTLTGASGLVLRAGPGLELTLETTGTSGGDIDFTGTTLIADPATGATPGRGAVQIRSRDAGNLVALGNLNAGSLLGAIGGDTFTTGLTRSAAVTVGDVTLADSPPLVDATLRLDAGTATLTTGTLFAPNITLNAGDLTLGGVTETGAITLTGTGALAAGVISGATSLTIDRGGSVSLYDVVVNGDFLVGQTRATRPSTISTTGTLTTTAGGSLRLTATGAVEVRGAASVAGAYAVTGGSVILGTAGGSITQAARGTVSVEATDGDVIGLAGLLLQSDRDGAGTTPLTIATSRAGGGHIDFTGASLRGGIANASAVRIAPGSTANIVTLGDVTASALQGDIVGGAYADTITRATTLTFGTLDLTTALTATSNGSDIRLDGAVIGAGQGITLSAANGALILPATLSALGAIKLTTGADLTTGDVVSTGSTVRIETGGNALSANSLTGATGLSIGAGTGAVSLRIGSGGTGTLDITAATLDGGGTTARTDLLTGGAMRLLLSDAARLATITAGAIDVNAGTIDLTGATAAGDVVLNAGGLISLWLCYRR